MDRGESFALSDALGKKRDVNWLPIHPMTSVGMHVKAPCHQCNMSILPRSTAPEIFGDCVI